MNASQQHRFLVLFAGLLMFAIAATVPAQDQRKRQPLPPLLLQISDAVGVFSEEEALDLSRLLSAIEEQTGTKIIVVIIPTVTPENISAYTQRLADRWIDRGRLRKDGRFVCVVIAKDDRVLWIAPSPTLARVRKSIENRETLRDARELLRQEQYYEALTTIANTLSILIRQSTVGV